MAKRATAPVIPYGLWPSPIAPADVARGARRFGLLQGSGDWVYWTEGRPAEGGRQALMRTRPGSRAAEELLPAPWSVRSRVHEYGGGEFLAAGDVVYFVNDRDQDVYELTAEGKPKRITSEASMRFADFALDQPRQRLIAVAERQHSDGRLPDNLLVTIALAGKTRGRVAELVQGRDFYASPRLSPDGAMLAFVAWDLPDMPWDQSELMLAYLDESGDIRGKPGRIAGGKGVAASHPSFALDGTLVFISDDNDWGNLNAYHGGTTRPLTRLKKEFGRPMWSLGHAPYAIAADNTIWAAPIADKSVGAFGSTVLSIDTRGRKKQWHQISENSLDTLSHHGDWLTGITTENGAPAMIRSYSLGEDYGEALVRGPGGEELDPDCISRPTRVAFKGGDGAKTFGLYYAPAPGDRAAPPKGSKPPALVLAHGGPTSSASRGLQMRIQFYTSRGFAVLDVDYAGSTGYGRAYRERLDGQWGIADVADCAAAARWLAKQGYADPKRIAIAGGSAGGYTTLMALATSDAFAAGSSHYGISDLTLLMQHTHKFESGYLHRLLGTTPKAWKKICRDRSPLAHIDNIKAPLILFQGLDDKVVPPEQSRLIAEKLAAQGQTVELHEFKGEGHGFRRAETIVSVLEAELAFLLRALAIG